MLHSHRYVTIEWVGMTLPSHPLLFTLNTDPIFLADFQATEVLFELEPKINHTDLIIRAEQAQEEWLHMQQAQQQQMLQQQQQMMQLQQQQQTPDTQQQQQQQHPSQLSLSGAPSLSTQLTPTGSTPGTPSNKPDEIRSPLQQPGTSAASTPGFSNGDPKAVAGSPMDVAPPSVSTTDGNLNDGTSELSSSMENT